MNRRRPKTPSKFITYFQLLDARRIEALQAEREEGRKARLALEFRLLKLSSDHKIARVDVESRAPIEESTGADTSAGTRSSARSNGGEGAR
jgi:hypothetical protein